MVLGALDTHEAWWCI